MISRTTYELLVSHVPQLLGMIHGSGGLPAGSSNPQPQPTPKTQAFVLGYGWDYPALREKPTHGRFEWWSQKRWEKHGPKGKQGQHETELNVGQLFIEGEDGDAVDGYTAKDCRDVTRALIRSLIWSGQAPSTEGRLSHEARVYVHVMLARRFPFLLLCDNGMWKINLLIKQVFPGTVKIRADHRGKGNSHDDDEHDDVESAAPSKTSHTSQKTRARRPASPVVDAPAQDRVEPPSLPMHPPSLPMGSSSHHSLNDDLSVSNQSFPPHSTLFRISPSPSMPHEPTTGITPPATSLLGTSSSVTPETGAVSPGMAADSLLSKAHIAVHYSKFVLLMLRL